jgi:hypothetical protein
MVSPTVVVFSISLLVSFVLGVRMLLRSRRTRQACELALGLALLGMGSVGYAFHVAARLLEVSPSAGKLLVVTAISLQAVGTGSLFYFVWQSFRPGEAWARSFGFFCFVLLAVSTAGDAFSRALSGLDGWGPWYWLGLAIRLIAVSWTAAESLRVYLLLRRQAAREPMDPLAPRSFLLLGLGASAATGAAAIAIAARIHSGVSVVRVPTANLAVCVLVLAASIGAWLALFPRPVYPLDLQGGAKPAAATEPGTA